MNVKRRSLHQRPVIRPSTGGTEHILPTVRRQPRRNFSRSWQRLMDEGAIPSSICDAIDERQRLDEEM